MDPIFSNSGSWSQCMTKLGNRLSAVRARNAVFERSHPCAQRSHALAFARETGLAAAGVVVPPVIGATTRPAVRELTRTRVVELALGLPVPASRAPSVDGVRGNLVDAGNSGANVGRVLFARCGHS